MPTHPRYDWGIAYYMSYDNNLDGFGAGIIAQIEEGIQSHNVVAAVQADFKQNNGMQRVTITSKGKYRDVMESEDSADVNQVIAYLRWFIKRYPCRKYMVVFLDHGGKVDEMCNDGNPQTKGQYWISGHALGQGLRAFRNRDNVPVELLFLQQCGRGSIENLYSFRGTAEYVMSSPVNVGAPNTYYSKFTLWPQRLCAAAAEGL